MKELSGTSLLWTNKWILENFLIRPVKKVGVRCKTDTGPPKYKAENFFSFIFILMVFFSFWGWLVLLAGPPPLKNK